MDYFRLKNLKFLKTLIGLFLTAAVFLCTSQSVDAANPAGNGKTGGTLPAIVPINQPRVINATKAQASQGKAIPKTQTKTQVPLVITLSFAGDCTLGEVEGDDYEGTVKAYYDIYGPEWFFANVKPIFSKDDLTFVNLEGPLTNIPQQVKKEFPIKGDVRNVECLTAGSVEVCNLANNHTWDCGDEGLNETEQVLQANNIAFCGGNNAMTMVECKGAKIAFLGFEGWSADEGTMSEVEKGIASAKEQGAELIAVEFHWGTELEYQHDAVEEALGHHAIDCGADIVIGGHPHVLQDTETYKGKLICYSMGNFSFGANCNPRDKDTVIVQQSFIKKNGKFVYGETRFIPCRISSTDAYNDYKPTPYEDPEDIQRVMAKLNQA